MTPEELRKEAQATEALARFVSYGRDKEWLLARAQELREQADRLARQSEERSWRPTERKG